MLTLYVRRRTLHLTPTELMSISSDPSKKTRLVVAGLAFLSVTAARAADLVTTLHFNPTLSREANPFASVFGFDTAQLVVSNVIGVLAFVVAPLLVYVMYPPSRREKTQQALGEYISLQLYRCRLEKRRLVPALCLGWPLPRDWLQATRAFGFAISWAVVFGSLQFTFGWWATNEWGMEWYKLYRSLFNFRGYPVIELIPIIVSFYIAAYLFFRMEFKRQKPEPFGAEQGGAGNGDKRRA